MQFEILTWIKLFDDEVNLLIPVWLAVFNETSKNFFHTLEENHKCRGVIKSRENRYKI